MNHKTTWITYAVVTIGFVLVSTLAAGDEAPIAATLEDLKPGWTVSVTTKHDGPREVAEFVRVVHEK